VAPRTDALVAVSEDVREEGLRLRIGTRDQYRVIPAYVDYHPSADDFTAARRRARERLEVSPDDAVIGWVGRFVPQKDPDTLAHALRRILLHRQDDHTRAVLVGDGPLRDRVQRQLAPLGSRALFTGRLANVRELYPAFDVLVHVSRWEGQPMVVEEAIAERIPVVATRVSGIEDLVRDGVGYVVGPGSVRGLADRALEVLAGSELRAPLSTEAVGQVAEGHDRAVTIAEHVRLYEELLRAWT
jgi:glycosyltransferase involved in cell wall biosynthesis